MPGRRNDETAKNGAVTAGAPLVSTLATAGAAPLPYDDPMSKVLGLDEKTSGLAAWFGFTSGSTLLMVVLMALASLVAWMHAKQARADGTPEEIDVVKEEAPPPPPRTEEPKPEPAAPAHRVRDAVPPPPAPAQAAKVLMREPDPNEPIDLTGNTIVQGSADAYAGGFTTASGSNANAVRSAPAATGVPGGTGPVKSGNVGGPDRSRPPAVAGDWDHAPFPPEADAMQVDEADVLLQVEVRADGTPSAVRVLSDPGTGFGREARQFALRQRYLPALDHDGRPIDASRKIHVHFSR